MSKLGILRKLEEKETKDEELVEEAIKNKELLEALLHGISSSNPRIKFRSAKILRAVSERNPRMLYSDWKFFAKLLDSENNIIKWNAMDIIANLTQVDSNGRFNRLFKKFYGHLYEGNLISAGHVVDNSGTIALARPELQDKITRELFKVEGIPLPTDECRNILIGKTIQAFDVYYDRTNDKGEIVSFVKRQLNNTRKATKAKAEKFLRKLKR